VEDVTSAKHKCKWLYTPSRTIRFCVEHGEFEESVKGLWREVK
jgi:hypothetical protein